MGPKKQETVKNNARMSDFEEEMDKVHIMV